MKYVAISDIHGHRDELQALMGHLKHEVDFNEAHFVFLGDYVDGGKDVRNVIEDCMAYEKLYPHWTFLYGNHEDMMLDALRHKSVKYHDYYQWYGQGGKETARSYYPEGLTPYEMALIKPSDYIPTDHLDWIESRPSVLETEEFIFVHAGLLPNHTVEQTPLEDRLWIRSKFYNSRYDWGKRVIFGHTFMEQPFVRFNMIGIDTMARSGGSLCAAILDSEHPERQVLISSDERATILWERLSSLGE